MNKEIIWVRELDCNHERTTHLNFFMDNYSKPNIGGPCFCRDCCSEVKIISVRELQRGENEGYYKWAEEFRSQIRNTKQRSKE